MSAAVLHPQDDAELSSLLTEHAKRLFGHDIEKSRRFVKNLKYRISKESKSDGVPLTPEALRSKVLAELQRQIAAAPEGRLALIQYDHGLELFKLDEALKALNECGASLGLYVFTNRLVAPSYDRKAKGFNDQDVGVFEFVEFNEYTFASCLGQKIAFGKQVKGALKATTCPPELRKAIFGSTHRLRAIEIKRVATTPLWRGDVLHAAPGFNAETHTWIESPQVNLPTLCDKAAAAKALAYIREWIAEFPFVAVQDEAVAIGAIVSAAMRASVRPPAIAITKPSHGAGASTLAELLYVVLTGFKAAVINGGNSSEEIDKEVNSAQLGGRAAILVDNIPPGGGFVSTALAQVITQDLRSFRILGQTKQKADIENSQMVILNGKALKLTGDMPRRCLAIALDPQMEKPELRTFKRPNLIEDALRDRVKILEAAFTIVAAYNASGEQASVQSLAGFDPWCRSVAAALRWLGEPDLISSQDKLKGDDPANQQLHRLFEVWRAFFGGKFVTAAEVINQSRATDDLDNPNASAVRADLEHLLEEIAPGSHGKVSAVSLGRFLGNNKGTVIGDFQLDGTSGHASTMRWRLKRLYRADDDASTGLSGLAAAATEKRFKESEPAEPPAPVAEAKSAELAWDDTAQRDALIKAFGISADWASRLVSDGFSTVEKIAAASWGRLHTNPAKAQALKARANALCAGRPA